MATDHKDRESIVSRALEIESAKERDDYIAEACGDDDDLKQQVKEEVEEHFQAEDQEDADDSRDGDTPPRRRGPAGGRAGHTESRRQPLTRIGPYKVLKLIAEGATSILFHAEQQEPVRRQVALRLIKEGKDWRQILARLEAERQALSGMDHPNVARLLDIGTCPSGQPYLVREWVEGVPITRYCDEKKLALQKRLELFVSVCKAVQHAHQKGVLHGDLEPSKVLVTDQDDRPVPHVLDFGVARAVGRKPTESPSATEPGGLDGKPEYMSPEQADANTRDLDARSDVYGLGILLYELLTGTTPLQSDRLENVPATKALQMVREEEIPPPSQRLDQLKDRQSSVAEGRQMQPKALAKALGGELDCVVMKALQKDPARRYETAHDLGRDVQRHLAHEPIEACPPSATARLGKLARRHSRLAATVGIALLLLLTAALAGTGLALWAFHKESKAQKSEEKAVEEKKKAEKEAEKARGALQQSEEKLRATTRERDEAQASAASARRAREDMNAILAFFKDKLLSAGRPSDGSLTDTFWTGVQGQGKDLTLRKAVDEAASKVGEVFSNRPLAEAGAREMLGLAYLNMEEPAKAVPQYERALALREAMQGVNDPDTAECRNQLAVAYRRAKRTTEASRLFDQDPYSPSHASALAARGATLLVEKKPGEAELTLRRCLNLRLKNQPDDWTTFDTQSLLGEALLDQKKYGDAEPLLLTAYGGLKKLETGGPPEVKDRLRKTLERLVRLYTAWGQDERVARWRKELQATETSKKP